jgi:Ca2+/H+ antiporter
MKKILTLIFFMSASTYALPPGSLGELTDKLMLPMSVLASALYNVSLAIGIALLFGALIQYRNHQNNPGQVPISRPVTLLIFGILLIVLPILAKFSQSALLVSRV